jgi:hypothetical protein
MSGAGLSFFSQAVKVLCKRIAVILARKLPLFPGGLTAARGMVDKSIALALVDGEFTLKRHRRLAAGLPTLPKRHVRGR